MRHLAKPTFSVTKNVQNYCQIFSIFKQKYRLEPVIMVSTFKISLQLWLVITAQTHIGFGKTAMHKTRRFVKKAYSDKNEDKCTVNQCLTTDKLSHLHLISKKLQRSIIKGIGSRLSLLTSMNMGVLSGC